MASSSPSGRDTATTASALGSTRERMGRAAGVLATTFTSVPCTFTTQGFPSARAKTALAQPSGYAHVASTTSASFTSARCGASEPR